MRKAMIAIAFVLFAFATAAAVSGGRVAAQTPSFGNLFPVATFPNVQVPASNFNLDLAFVEYGPGAFSATESHQGTRFYVVYEGELTIMIGDKSATYDAGKSVLAPPGAITKFSNAGTKPARVYYSAMVPAWAASNPSTVLAPAGATAPKVLASGSVPVREQRSTVNMTLQGLWLDPGAALPNHIMNEYNRGLVMDGTTTFEYLDGGRVVAPAGQVQTMDVGRPGTAANRGTTRVLNTHTWLSTPGAALTSAAPAAAVPATGPITPPRTGDAGLMAATDARERFAELILLAIVTTAIALATRRSFSRNDAKDSLSR